MKRLGIIGGILVGSALIGLLLFRIIFVRFVDNYEFGFTYDKFKGEITLLDRTGYFIQTPWHYSVHAIDLRPIQLQIIGEADGIANTMEKNDISQRVLNAKLVQFETNGLMTFVSWHGRGAGDNRDRLAKILRCYAFDRAGGRDCPFIKILGELAPDQGVTDMEKPRLGNQ